MLDIDLVNDAGIGGNHVEAAERPLAPAQERVTFAVAREFELRVERKRVRACEIVDLDRMIDDELDRLQRIDAIRVTTKIDHRVTHGCEIDDARHAREILQQHARRHERDFLLDVRDRVPARKRLDVVGLDECVVLTTQKILEENLHRVRQPRDSAETRLLEGGEAIYLDCFSACADLLARIESISCVHTNRNDTSLISITYLIRFHLGTLFATYSLEVSV